MCAAGGAEVVELETELLGAADVVADELSPAPSPEDCCTEPAFPPDGSVGDGVEAAVSSTDGGASISLATVLGASAEV